ncbi:signal peptidase I [Sporolactobacillus sp. CPB3-1]|uniref:Signal peptidase I n=1 Tax=Sporolactobacillus mangiferae TaxID=2940498 RepID=A0ABT0M7D1_9BACL|nr:signal peptidase I [Sporolactobacillus mangiferae]MCL1630744.1 signal peptidase I [Sporolactobacillus mangiferae]
MSTTKKEFWSWVRAVAIAIVIALLVRHFIFSNYIVRGESMMPTLDDGDRLIVNKIGYSIGSPHRFDIIVFHANETDDFVKRVIGLPGDTIVYKNDQLYVNGRKVAEPYLKAYKDALSDGQLLTENFSLKSKTSVVKVPEGKLWVMGDNRRNSEDSRYLGFISQKAVVGKVSVRYWPFNHLTILQSLVLR